MDEIGSHGDDALLLKLEELLLAHPHSAVGVVWAAEAMKEFPPLHELELVMARVAFRSVDDGPMGRLNLAIGGSERMGS